MNIKDLDLYGSINRIALNPKRYRFETERVLAQLNLLPPSDLEKITPIFIISTGRTGTKFLADLLNTFENIYSVHEPIPDFLGLGIKYAKKEISLEKAIQIIEQNRRHLFKDAIRKKSKIYIESNNRLFSLIKPINNLFKKNKIIHIVRDGRDFVRSCMSRPYGNYYSDNDPYERITAKNFKNDYYYESWDSFSEFEKICWLWQKKDSMINDDTRGNSNAITVGYEEIFNKENNYKGIFKIIKILGIDEEEAVNKFLKMKNNRINKSKKYAIPHWTKWDKNMINSFNEIAGKHMKNYTKFYKY